MRTVAIGGRQVQMPSPVYIVPETVEVSEDSEDTDTIRGKCVFPSSDPTVGERVDHANICHEMFVVWSCGHIWAERKGLGRLFAIKTRQEVVGGRMTPPDTEIDFVVSITMRKHGDRVVGSAKAEFSLDGKPLLRIDVDEFKEKKT